jgi:phosphate transport system substrate-binding protein
MKTLKFAKIVLLILISTIVTANAQKQREYIYISGTKFTYPLIERWISEYRKVNPQARIKLLTGKQAADSTNLKIVAHTLTQDELKPNEAYFHVGKFALLPITNDRNLVVKKEFRKGLKQEDLKKVFFTDPNSILEEPGKKPSYTVYTRTNQSCSSIAFASHFGLQPSEIKGKKISGEDQYLVLAIQKDSTGITYNNPGYIYDIQSRLPVKGISILPIDLNENGKIDKDELIYDNLDALTQSLEDNQNTKLIPEDYVSFVVNKVQKNETLRQFINWVTADGQKFNHTYGFLNTNTPGAALSQNISWPAEGN